MKTKIQKKMNRFIKTSKARVTLEMSSENPVWYADPHSPFVQSILRSIEAYNGKSLPAITMHATMEAGILTERYPDIQWVSLGATVHGMHTTHEHIYKADLEEFCGRIELIVSTLTL
ncbi:hypothetical protein H6768_06005 [Candidatus Peribacteria bacterium]|nr:hypothetical protein [Candidatus Peribacteria bacterium]